MRTRTGKTLAEAEAYVEEIYIETKVSIGNLLAKFGWWLFVALAGLVLVVYGVVRSSKYIAEQASVGEVYVDQKIAETKDYVIDTFGLVRYEVNIIDEESEADKELIIKQYSEQFGILPIAMKPIFHQESGNNPFRWRYEETWEKQYKNSFPCPSNYNSEECKMWFSSIGETQVSFPIWHEKCGVKHPLELFNKKVNYKCSFTIMAECLYRHAHLANSIALRTCYKAYNGSGEMADRYADKLMSKLADYTIEKEKLINAVENIKKEEQVQKELETEKSKVENELKDKIAMLKK